MKLRLALFSLTIWGMVGCGTPGAPQPPSLHLPKPITDLKAVRNGDKVYLSWTAPAETTDGEGIRSEGTVLVCRALQTQSGANCRDKAGQVPLPPTNEKPDRHQAFVDDVAPVIAGNDPRDFFTYNVIAANGRGKTAGASNPVTVFLAPSVPPAQDVRVSVQPDTVVLTWVPQPAPVSRLNAQFAQRVYRSGEGRTGETGEPVLLATLGGSDTTYKDTTFTWEKPYTYTVAAVTKVLSRDGSKTLDEFEGEASAPLKVTPHDTFAPAAPRGLQAVYSSGFVDLAWSPNTESDIAGYNVYRGTQKLNDKPIGASAFRDDKLQGVAPGTELTYYVTAVDTQGNESERSQPATERVPKP